MCVVCLGAQHAQAALEGAACVHCDQLPLRTLRSRRALFEEGGLAGVPRGSGPASAEAGRRLMSWGSQMDVTEGLETGPALSLPSPVASASVSIRRQEARVAVSSAPVDTVTLMASSSEELDVVSMVTGESEDPPLQSPTSEELMEVLSRAVAKLNIDWPAEKQEQTVRSKLDERFLPSWSAQPPRRALPFFPDLHTEVSRSWKKPVSTHVYTPQTSIYSNVAGMRKHGYGAMPRADETLASHLSPQAASSLKAPTLPTKPLKTTSALVGKAYSAAGQAAACLHTMSILQAYQADLLKDLGESDEVGADLIQELRLTADLALRATKDFFRHRQVPRGEETVCSPAAVSPSTGPNSPCCRARVAGTEYKLLARQTTPKAECCYPGSPSEELGTGSARSAEVLEGQDGSEGRHCR
ncbi:hypothetical protein DPX16_1823 [Anabarilius grahami]|uniref:Uncharacterized protein n=1 Tax=Anabarilius grahami TaxID=495550 RepID=A0A3N0Z9D2_ANAGA|nr:hypothetical protein DPX16_1823 [Anabarilius grahami]